MTEVLRKMLVAGAAVAALSVAACGQPAETTDTNTEVAADAMTNDVVADTTVVTNDATVVTNDATVVTNDVAVTNDAAE